MTSIQFEISSESIEGKEISLGEGATYLATEAKAIVRRRVAIEQPAYAVIEGGIYASTKDSGSSPNIRELVRRAVVRGDSIVVYEGDKLWVSYICGEGRSYERDTRSFLESSAVLAVLPAKLHPDPPITDSMSLAELDDAHLALREALGTLSRVRELALEDACDEPSMLAIANAGVVLRAMFAVSPQTYDIYPMGGGEIAIDGGGRGWRIGVFCYSDNSVQYVGWKDGESEEAHGNGVQDIPVDFLWRVLRQSGL